MLLTVYHRLVKLYWYSNANVHAVIWLAEPLNTISHYSSPVTFLRYIAGLNWSRDAIVFIRGETLSAHGARPKKKTGWKVLVPENFSVNGRTYKK